MLILALQLSEKPDLFRDLCILIWNSNIRRRYIGIIKNWSDLSICFNIIFVINSFGLSKNTSRMFKFHFFFFKMSPDIISVKFIFNLEEFENCIDYYEKNLFHGSLLS